MVSISGITLFGRERLIRLPSQLRTISLSALATSRPPALGTQSSASFGADTPSSIPIKSTRLRCTEVDEHGGITRRYISSEKTERLTTLYGLVPRDIRKLAASTHSHIRIRPSTVLLHIFHLKVLVQRDRILLFDDATNVASRAAFLRELRERILQGDTVQQERYSQQRLTFEFRALEAVLSVVVSELEAELETVRRSAERVLRCLEDDVDRRTLITLLSLSNKVVQFARQAELVRSALDNVLDRDERVAALYLTAKGTRDGRAKSVDDDLTVAERLLGSYYIAYNEIVQDAQNLVSGLRNTQESASAMLDSNRNSMILLDLKFRIGTLGLATGSLLTAFYNMNISTYIREYMWAFPAVSWTSAMFAAATLLYVSVVLRKLVRVKMKVHGEAMTTTWK